MDRAVVCLHDRCSNRDRAMKGLPGHDLGRAMLTGLLQSIPSPTKIRDELERMVLNDLLGPVGGPEEEIDEPSVRDRYLVGMLAPKRQELSPEEFDELPQGGSGAVEDGTA